MPLILQGPSALQFGSHTGGTEPNDVCERSGCGDPCLEIVRVDPCVPHPQATPLRHCRDDLAQGGWWRELWTAAREHPNHGFRHQADEDEHSRRGAAAQSRVERGRVSRARHELNWRALGTKNHGDSERAEGKAAAGEFESQFAPRSPLPLDGKRFAPRREVLPHQEGARTRC